MAYSYVTWKNRTPLSSASFTQMSDNDQELSDIADPLPQGVRAWISNPDDQWTQDVDAAYDQYLNFYLPDVYIPAIRLTLVRQTFSTLMCSLGYVATKARIKVHIDGTMVASRETTILGGKKSSMDSIKVIRNLTEGLHTFHTEIGIFQPNGLAAVSFRNDPGQPGQLSVEDKGAYIATG